MTSKVIRLSAGPKNNQLEDVLGVIEALSRHDLRSARVYAAKFHVNGLLSEEQYGDVLRRMDGAAL